MTEKTAAATAVAPVPATRLEPDAIGVAQDTVIGMASSAPAASVGLTLAALAAAAAYGGLADIVVTLIPMLIIANAYRRLNMWNANCGASFEWVGRAINPYLGFLTGWLMIAGYIIATASGLFVLAPTVLMIFRVSTTSTWGNIGIITAVGAVMLVIAVMGIKLTARTQVGVAVVEYGILLTVAVWGLIAVLSHRVITQAAIVHGHHVIQKIGTYPITHQWFSLWGIGGKGVLAGGFIAVVFIFTGWDGTLYVNEEVKHRRVNPGRAAMLAVAFLGLIYAISIVGLQGVVNPATMGQYGTAGTALTSVAQDLGGTGWGRAMALALALSTIATTGTGIVLTSRIVYGMATYRALPQFLGNVSRRFATPVGASILVGFLIVAFSWVFLLTTSIQGVFYDVVNVTSVLFMTFYILTAMAMVAYYRRRLFSSLGSGFFLGVLPVASAIGLAWIIYEYMKSPTVTASVDWSLVGVVGLGIVLLFVARFVLKSPFFQLRRESEAK
jgi:amino acid transporter